MLEEVASPAGKTVALRIGAVYRLGAGSQLRAEHDRVAKRGGLALILYVKVYCVCVSGR